MRLNDKSFILCTLFLSKAKKRKDFYLWIHLFLFIIIINYWMISSPIAIHCFWKWNRFIWWTLNFYYKQLRKKNFNDEHSQEVSSSKFPLLKKHKFNKLVLTWNWYFFQAFTIESDYNSFFNFFKVLLIKISKISKIYYFNQLKSPLFIYFLTKSVNNSEILNFP